MIKLITSQKLVSVKRYWLLGWMGLFGVMFMTSCNLQVFPVGDPDLGILRLEGFVAVGDGYTAGIANTVLTGGTYEGLYEEAQLVAFPQLIANQMQLAEPIPFGQHLASGTGSGYLRMRDKVEYGCEGALRPINELIQAEPTWQERPVDDMIINNWGIHQLAMKDIDADSLGLANPYFRRMQAAQDSTQTYLGTISQQEVSFFTFWLGMQDVLPFAIKGGNLNWPMTPVDVFRSKLLTLLDTLLSRTPLTRGIVADIPDITQFPYFQAVASMYMTPGACQTAAQAIYITMADGSIRVATANDLILLPAMPYIGEAQVGGKFGLSPAKAIPHDQVLDEAEVALVRAQIDAYNLIIREQVSAINTADGSGNPLLLRANVAQLFTELVEGKTDNGVTLTNTFLTGGVFALDGLTLTPRGQSMMANFFIERINETPRWRARIPVVSMIDYPGNIFP